MYTHMIELTEPSNDAVFELVKVFWVGTLRASRRDPRMLLHMFRRAENEPQADNEPYRQDAAERQTFSHVRNLANSETHQFNKPDPTSNHRSFSGLTTWPRDARPKH